MPKLPNGMCATENQHVNPTLNFIEDLQILCIHDS